MRAGALSKISSIFTVVVLTGLASAPVSGHQIDVRTPKTLEELKPRLVNIIDEHDVPGLAVSIIEANSVAWSGGFGLANRLSVDQVSATSSFRAASISKTVTAIAIMQLVESGGLGRRRHRVGAHRDPAWPRRQPPRRC